MFNRVSMAIVFFYLIFSIQSTAEISIDKLLSHQKQNLSSIESVDITFTEDWEPSEYVKKNTTQNFLKGSRHLVSRYQQEGKKYRAETGLEGTILNKHAEANFISAITAFDLNKYQMLDKKSLHLSVHSKELPSFINLPILGPYSFLGLKSSQDINAAVNESKWDALIKNTTLENQTECRGHPCHVVKIEVPGRNMYYKVFFANELDYFPIRTETYIGNTLSSEKDVLHVEKIDTKNGTVYIPMETISKTYHFEKGHLIYTLSHAVGQKTLVLNEDIDDGVFTIPLHMAKTYEDVDDINAYWSIERTIEKEMTDVIICSKSKIALDNTLIDLGKVGLGQTCKATFTVKNEGYSPLSIKLLKASCNCSVATIDEQPIAPKQNREIEVYLTAPMAEGVFSSDIAISTNDTKQKILNLGVKGIAQTILKMTPPTILCGDIRTTSLPVTKVVDIKPGSLASAATFDTLSVKNDNAFLKTELIKNENSARLKIEFPETTPIGAIREKLSLKVNEPFGYEIDIPIVGYIKGGYEITPSSLFFGKVFFGISSETLCEIKPIDELDKIEVVTDPVTYNENIRFEIDRNSTEAILKAIVIPQDKPLVYEGSVKLKILKNNKNPQFIQIPIVYIVREEK